VIITSGRSFWSPERIGEEVQRQAEAEDDDSSDLSDDSDDDGDNVGRLVDFCVVPAACVMPPRSHVRMALAGHHATIILAVFQTEALHFVALGICVNTPGFRAAGWSTAAAYPNTLSSSHLKRTYSPPIPCTSWRWGFAFRSASL
jgi:hypothetical protein